MLGARSPSGCPELPAVIGASFYGLSCLDTAQTQPLEFMETKLWVRL